MRPRSELLLRLLCLVNCCCTPWLFGAGVPVSGVVIDPLGAPIEGALVEARIVNHKGRPSPVSPVLTGPDGRYDLTGVFEAGAADQVQLTVSRAGFAAWRGLARTAPATIRLNLAPVVTSVELGASPDTASAAQPVTTLERAGLREPGLSVLSQSASTAPGLHTLSTSPAMGAFMVRGLTGKHVAVLRDGVRYTTSAQRGGVSTFFNLLDAGNGIDTVEVLRGPNGAEHGSDSIGGAVVALSPAPPDFDQPVHGEASATYESAAHSFGPSASLSFGGRRLAAVTRLAARRVNTLRPAQGLDSHAAITRFLGLPSNLLGGESGRLPDTGFTSYGGSFHGQARLGVSSHLVLHYDRGQQDGTKRYDQLLGGDGNLIADVRNLMADFGYLRWEHWNAGAAGDAVLDRFTITGSYNAQREERVNQGGQGDPLGVITHQYEKTRVSGLQLQAARRLPAAVELTGGGEAYWERIAAPSFQLAPATGRTMIVRPRIPDHARYLLHGVYLQGVWQPLRSDRLRLSAATRFGGASYRSAGNLPLWPADSLAANALTGRAGGVFWAKSWLGVHVNWARGFRVPSVTDLGTVGLQGNGAFEAAVADLAGRSAMIGDRADDRAVSTGRALERLRPEDSRNIDYGVRFRHHDRFTADVTVFHLSLGNAIVSQTLILPPGAVGAALGDQTIVRQLASGAVFVPASSSPVLVRGNYAGFRERGLEQSLQWRPASSWRIRQNVTWLRAEDAVTGLPPDVEPGLPPVTANLAAAYTRRRFWIEARAHAAGRQSRLSSLALSDRRIGNPRSRATIASFFNNGARARGLVSPSGILIPTGETLAMVQDRVAGATTAAVPQFTALPGYLLLGLSAGVELTERCTLDLGLSNLADRRHRGIGWGVDGPGRGAAVSLRYRF